MKKMLLFLLLFSIQVSFAQKKEVLIKHLMTPFNGMHAGFTQNGKPGKYVAQVTKMENVVDFSPQEGSTNPPLKFGFYQMTYSHSQGGNPIRLVFSLPPNKNFKITTTVRPSVDKSTFSFELLGQPVQIKTAKKDFDTLVTEFKGNATGSYDFYITPIHTDASTFLLTEILIEEK
jgi:hypothetical protein